MAFLYEKIRTLKEAGITAVIPQFLLDNLSSNIKLRDYQKEAIHDTILYLNSNLSKNKQTHILYHMATGSGKTFTVANVVQEIQRPTLVLAHNKTLAAQLYSEFKQFFPNNSIGKPLSVFIDQ